MGKQEGLSNLEGKRLHDVWLADKNDATLLVFEQRVMASPCEARMVCPQEPAAVSWGLPPRQPQQAI